MAEPATFEAQLQAGRGGGAYVLVPDEVVAGWGGGRRARLTGRLNEVEFASSTMGMGDGRVALGVHKATRQAAGAQIGDVVRVELRIDDRPRIVDVPPDLATALAADQVAGGAFERLSFTHRREYVEWIISAKREQTRVARVRQTVERLRGSGRGA